MSGWVKLWRKMESSDVWLLPPLYKSVWIWILIHANHEESEWMGEKIGMGELITSYSSIARGTSFYENRRLVTPSVKSCRTAITKLHNLNTLRHEPRQGALWIKVLHWDEYQGYEDDNQGRDLSELGQNQGTDRGNKQEEKNVCTVLTTNTVITTATRDVAEVFAYWQQVMGRTKCKLGPDRRGKVEARLREGYSVADIKKAIDGCALSPWHMGDNPRGKKYNDLVKICEKSSVLEGFMEDAETPASPLDRLFKDIEL